MNDAPERIAARYIELLPLLHRRLDKPAMLAAGRKPASELTHLQYHILEELYQQPEGITMTQLAGTIQVAKQQLTPLIAKLQEKEFVSKTEDHRDKRAVKLRLTEKGRSTVSLRWEGVYREYGSRFAGLSEEDRADLSFAIDKMIRILNRLGQ